MKHLSIMNTFFSLPEDFNGNYADALRLLADYLDSPSPYLTKDPEKEYKEINEDPWQSFLEVKAAGGRVSGIFGLKKLSLNMWVDIKPKKKKRKT